MKMVTHNSISGIWGDITFENIILQEIKKNNPRPLKHLKLENKKLIIDAIELYYIKYHRPIAKNINCCDEEIALVLLSKNKSNILYLPEQLRNDIKIIKLIKLDKYEYIERRLALQLIKVLNNKSKDNIDIILYLMDINYKIIKYASERLKNDDKIIQMYPYAFL